MAAREKKFTYELSRAKESAHAEYEKLRNEKEELKVEVVKYKEQIKALQADLNHFQSLKESNSSKLQDFEKQLELSENQCLRLQRGM